MTLHPFAKAIIALAAILLSAPAAMAQAKRPPNLILIMADDFGYECVGANGGTSYKTPNLDKLAANGVRFERCYVQPLCTPTRIQLMTGKYNVHNYTRFGHLLPEATTFAQILKKAGYLTCMVGKWQLGQGFNLPNHFGFDEYCLWQLNRRPPRYANPGLEINGKEFDYKNGEYGPDLVNDYALDFLKKAKDRPFLLYYSMMLTHDPFQPTPDSPDFDPKAIGEKVNQNVKHFADMTTYMDKLIGKLVDRLDTLGLSENTLILFLGDNGTGKGVPSRMGNVLVLGGKGSVISTGMHVPCIASWKGTIPAGKTDSKLVDSTDFLPTLCEAAGTVVPKELKIDGQSFLNRVKGDKGPTREWIYCWYGRDGGAKADHEFAYDLDYKLYTNGKIYRYSADPKEETPLTDAPAETRARLQAVLDSYASARPADLTKWRMKK